MDGVAVLSRPSFEFHWGEMVATYGTCPFHASMARCGCHYGRDVAHCCQVFNVDQAVTGPVARRGDETRAKQRGSSAVHPGRDTCTNITGDPEYTEKLKKHQNQSETSLWAS